MINITPVEDVGDVQELDRDEEIEGEECEESKKLNLLKEGMENMIEIISDEEAMEEESKITNFTMRRIS